MKLYVWASPYQVMYGTSGLFVVAEDLDQAKALARNAPRYTFIGYRQGNGVAMELGEPTRIVDLPCAEWHEWSE